jgi:chromosome segregation protein
MEDVFKGSNIRKEVYQTLSQKYLDFGEIYRDLDAACLEARAKSQTFRELFMSNLATLLTFQVPNIYEISYRGKSLKSHSVGQRASAMMLFILSQNENDVFLIDQPEDDLDNQIIYDEVIKLIRQLKPNQQFIFATHNANFPVLGDAELVVSCQFSDEKVSINSGSIDCKQIQKKL